MPAVRNRRGGPSTISISLEWIGNPLRSAASSMSSTPRHHHNTRSRRARERARRRRSGSCRSRRAARGRSVAPTARCGWSYRPEGDRPGASRARSRAGDAPQRPRRPSPHRRHGRCADLHSPCALRPTGSPSSSLLGCFRPDPARSLARPARAVIRATRTRSSRAGSSSQLGSNSVPPPRSRATASSDEAFAGRNR